MAVFVATPHDRTAGPRANKKAFDRKQPKAFGVRAPLRAEICRVSITSGAQERTRTSTELPAST